MNPRILRKDENLAKCLEMIGTAAREGARLIVFPECALTGYVFSNLAEAMTVTETVPGPSTEKLAARCQEMKVYAVVGLLEREGDKCFNVAVLLGPEGLVGKYRKTTTPCLGVDRFVTRGEQGYKVYSTEIGNLGILICYDVRMPETARVLSLGGADIVAVPSNWPVHGELYPEFMVQARACENHIYVIATNRVGEEREATFIGRSQIADPSGQVLAEAGQEEETIVFAEASPGMARHKHLVRKRHEFELDLFNDRRPELYLPLVERSS